MTELLTTIAGVGRVLIAVAVTLLVGSMAGLVLLALRRRGADEDNPLSATEYQLTTEYASH